MKWLLVVAGIIAVVAGILIYRQLSDNGTLPQAPLNPQSQDQQQITSFEECVAAGNTVSGTTPRQCVAGGQTFTEETDTDTSNGQETSDMIRLDSPSPNTVVTSPLEVTGEARGTWYFEADFSVRLLDSDGNELGVGIAQAQDDWMTEEFVPFEATIEFQTPQSTSGTLLLQKSNPSGLPENDAELSIPVRFAQ